MNAFSSFAETAIPRAVRRRIERKESVRSPLEKKMDEKDRLSKAVKRRSKGTPDRRRRGTPFSDNMMLVC